MGDKTFSCIFLRKTGVSGYATLTALLPTVELSAAGGTFGRIAFGDGTTGYINENKRPTFYLTNLAIGGHPLYQERD